MSLRVAEEYVSAFGQLAKKGTAMIIPTNPNNVASMVAQTIGIFKHINGSGDVKDTQDGKTYRDPVLDSTSGDEAK